MVETDRALEPQFLSPAREAGDRDAIAEDVVDPAQLGWFWRDHEPRLEQLLVVAVARPEHHPMLAKRDRLLVGIGRHVPDGQKSHRPDTETHAAAGSAAEFAAAHARPCDWVWREAGISAQVGWFLRSQ